MSRSPPPPLTLPHIFISNNNNNNLLLGLALHTSTPTTLSLSTSHPYNHQTTTTTTPSYGYEQQQPSLTLSLLFPATTTTTVTRQQQLSSRDNISASFSNNSFASVKREREDPEPDAAANNDVCDQEVTKKKKLRLNKQQSALLEDSFKLHTTLNTKQKEALARQLNLRPRQVEVWFQNRRARTKLKQTEVDCEFLKKCCERLAEENEKLHKELQHLTSLDKQQQSFYIHPTTRLSTHHMCPSCHHQQVLPTNDNNNILISSKKRIIFNPFTEAC